MKLRNEGPTQPAPALAAEAGLLTEIVASWPGISAFTHWRLGSPGIVDGAEYHISDAELGHVHLDANAHILLNDRLAGLLRRARLGKSPTWSGIWMTQPVRSSTDVRHAAWLFRLAYDRLCGTSEEDLADRIANAARNRARRFGKLLGQLE